MAKPLVMEIPHDLGRDEAKRRLEEGTEKGKALLQKSGITVEAMTWTGDHLDFALSSLGQKIDGQVDVNPDTVRLEVRLPLLLSFFAEKLQKIVGNEGTKLLTKK
ncbi:polyhydroxyalkanoic acid system family protein [Methylobacterium sp. WL9]|uniref:polyhydroxyalkanoic acid system family protein n=1 Tax=Methylobacterium sp. WL9 TaxID=2603898 RepID=UPI0011CA589C|nr:polyhydroxyalkanoic acid system family protein [Methylobacterium sp. WL9]TXN21858.1 polyhydroxyalkanoic acid synthase [Methylobacterium sp. WL9]